MEYNLANLSPEEFEVLCSDIMGILLEKDFRTFSSGADGGIDIKLTSGSNDIIGQCKRYSNQSDLMHVIEKEKTKISEKHCKKYYLFTACALSNDNHTKIFNMFSEFMDDQSQIFDGNRICSLLKEEKYKPVLEKNFKLWATTEKVFEILLHNETGIDVASLKQSVDKKCRYYVDTENYRKVLNTLLENKIVLIMGSAGVGKTTISEMIVLYMLSKIKDIKLVYSSYGNISTLKSSMARNPSIKELIYIDDFLGQAYFDISNDKLSNINSLIDYVSNCKNKYLLLNTRITVLNEARKNCMSFDYKVDEINIHQININELSISEKAKILYNHIFFSKIPANDKKELLVNKRYMSIIKHKNYNPRVIEFICNSSNYIKSRKNYISFVSEVLRYPERIWEESYSSRLLEVDRLFLLTLYGISSNVVYVDLHKEAFNKVIEYCQNIDKTKNNYDECLERLVGEYIELLADCDSNKNLIKVINPSMNEVLANHFTLFNNLDYKKSIISFEQHLRAYKDFSTSELFEKYVISNRLEEMKYNDGNLYHALLLYFESKENPPLEMKNMYLRIKVKNITGGA